MNFANCKAYEWIEEQELPSIHSKGYVLRHKKTNAHIGLIANDDPNKVFYVGFRTPSIDSTGAAHIVEHTVLCGSKRFPAKDPFVELVKGSLNTFLNAVTYPDKTIYPVASMNDKDFQNLMHVYLDAVFYPNIYQRKEIFQQEGWHYELTDPKEPITLNGVVYNEMKGAFSSPDDVLNRQILNSLYPDTSYRFESGGDPTVIPSLTYEQFLDFHRRYYHPSNAYLYLYGDLDMEERLNWIDREYLSKFDALTVDSAVLRQQPFAEPVERTGVYSIASNEELSDHTYLSCSYSVDTVLNEKLYLAFDILDYALLGAPGAPLKQALLDAGIGKDIMSSFDNSIYQPIFSIVAKNSNPEKKEEFLQIIARVLKQQAEEGISKRALAAALNSLEFKYREADFGAYPKGLMYGLQCLDSWLYDEARPFLHLDALKIIDWLKQQVETDYFENLIKTYLLENPHQAIVTIEPKRGLNGEEEAALAEKLAAYKASLSPQEIETLIEETAHLEAYQEEPSTKEELESIPMLTRADLKREAEGFVHEERREGEVPLLFHEVETNGIAYFSLLFDTTFVAAEDIPYLGMLKHLLGYLDTEHYRYAELDNEINFHTGGIDNVVSAYPYVKKEGFLPLFELRAKALYEKVPKAMELAAEIVSRTQFTDYKRIREVLEQLKSRLQMGLSSSGHSTSALRAMSYFSTYAKYMDLTSGIAFYAAVRDTLAQFEQKKEQLAAKFQELVQLVFRPEHLKISIGCKEEGYRALMPALSPFVASLWRTETVKHHDTLVCSHCNEGFLDASQVQYVSRAGSFQAAGPYTGALRILQVILSYDYLWLNLRVKGGAYGCMSGFTRRGDSYFTSYRDPNLERTNEVYEGTVEYLRNFQVEERDMTKYIIGTISNLDVPLTPAGRIQRSLSAYLTGLTLTDVQKERDQVLDADEASIRALAEPVAAILAEDALCVIGNEEKIKEQSGLFGAIKDLY